MFIVDAHEDIAINALHHDRDVRRSTTEQRAREAAASKESDASGAITGMPDTVMIGLPELRRGGVGLVCSTIFCLPGEQEAITADAWAQLRYYQGLAAEPDAIGARLITSRAALDALTRDHAAASPGARPVGFLLLMEGADPIRDPSELQQWYDAGLRLIGPTWRGSRYCGGTGHPGGFTDLGFALLDEMARLGMVLDFSHMADDAVWQALERYPGPVIASHTNCRVYTPTDRHFTDEQIQAIADRGGVIGVVLHNGFLVPGWTREQEPVALDAVVRHIDHVCQLVGDARHSGIGSDFDGGAGVETTPEPFDTVADLARIADALRERGYNEEDITGIMGGNFVRAFAAALP
ncbi:MAG TPA: membrane dipeptidase [Ktedonobacterales bacterium]|nr:membrane dipeptidase [Ktedonobacterales bacterium]